MGQIAVAMIGPQGAETGVELPDNVPMKLMLPTLVEALGYGQGCALYNRSQHFWYQPTDSLGGRNTFAGDKLRLMPRDD